MSGFYCTRVVVNEVKGVARFGVWLEHADGHSTFRRDRALGQMVP